MKKGRLFCLKYDALFLACFCSNSVLLLFLYCYAQSRLGELLKWLCNSTVNILSIYLQNVHSSEYQIRLICDMMHCLLPTITAFIFLDEIDIHLHITPAWVAELAYWSAEWLTSTVLPSITSKTCGDGSDSIGNVIGSAIFCQLIFPITDQWCSHRYCCILFHMLLFM